MSHARRFSSASSTPLGSAAAITEGFAFRLLPNCGVQLHVEDGTRYAIAGPTRARAILHRIAGRVSNATHGRLSPITPVNVISHADRVKSGIPENATHYSFAYPLDCLRDDFDTLMHAMVGSTEQNNDDEAVLMFFLLGGFVYFAADAAGNSSAAPGRIIAVNALSLSSKAPAELFFDGPYAAPEPVVKALEREDRMSRVTIGRLKKAGIHEFAWVYQNEKPGGHALSSDPNANPHGCYVYTTKNAEHAPFYYALRPRRVEKGEPRRFSFSSEQVPEAHNIHHAFTDMIGAYSEAKTYAEQLEDDLASWRTSPMQKWLKQYGLLLLLYYLVGIIVYGLLEGWAPLDVCYYLTTTVTTVGYGDFSPSSAAARWITSFYAPFGTVAVMSALLPSVEWCLLQVDEVTAGPIASLERIVSRFTSSNWDLVRRKLHLIDQLNSSSNHLSRSGRVFGRVNPRETLAAERRRWARQTTHAPHIVQLAGWGGQTYEVGGDWAYVHAMIGPVLLTIVGVTLSYFFSQYSLCDSLYWTIITMTTVGYGDLVPQDTSHKLYTMVFMPLAATTLAATVERFDKLNTSQRIHKTNFNLIVDNMLREEAMVQQEILPALSEEAFVLRVLVEENMVEESTIKELKGRFHGMLNQGKGLVRGESLSNHGVPRFIDAEVIFYLLIQQGRVVDRNVDLAKETNEKRRQHIAAGLGPTRAAAPGEEEEMGGVSKASRQASRRIEHLRAESKGMGRGHERGLMTDHHGDVVTAVDMSQPDHGFQEWFVAHWIPSLQECGLEPGPADWARYAKFKDTMEKGIQKEADAKLMRSPMLAAVEARAPASIAAMPPAPAPSANPEKMGPSSPAPWRRVDGYAVLKEEEPEDASYEDEEEEEEPPALMRLPAWASSANLQVAQLSKPPAAAPAPKPPPPVVPKLPTAVLALPIARPEPVMESVDEAMIADAELLDA